MFSKANKGVNMKCKNGLKQFVILGLVLTGLMGCKVKKEIITQPGPVFPVEEYQELIRQGDVYFSQMHLYGWRKAEEFYSKAYEMKPTPELRDKRFLTLCLAIIREKQEKIVNPEYYERIQALGDFSKTQKQQYLFDIVQHYRSLPVIRKDERWIRAKEKKQVDASLFDFENSPLDIYLYLYCLNYYTYRLAAYNESAIQLLKQYKIFELMKKYSMSPLFMHSNFQSISKREQEVEERFPGFAEFLVYKANKLFSARKLRQAHKYYQKALDLIPDYPNAINGIANIYYFTINDYNQAITYYQRTLDLDRSNPVALFGKGVSLHHLEKYQQSNEVLDFMLANCEMYHGQAYYYKAYNWYHLEDPDKSRELIDRAKSLLPYSGEVNFLSGLLYYNRGKLKEAREDFIRTLYDKEYSPCYPLYYLGLIKLKKQDWSFLRDFSDSVDCFEKALLNMSKRIEEIDSMDLEAHQKEWMRTRRQLQLEEFKKASKTLIDQMQTIIAKNKDKKKVYDLQRVNAEFNRVKELIARDPDRLNAGDQEGATLLHNAVVKGHEQVVNWLLSKGAHVNIKDNTGYTPLHWAVLVGHIKIAVKLIETGADVNVTSPDGLTPLHDAAYNGRKEIIRLLIHNGAKPDARDDLGKTPLDLAIENKRREVLPLLKPMHMAARNREIARLRELIETYPDLVNARDENGRTPLHEAAIMGHKDIARLLIDSGATVDAGDIDGLMPLELAKQHSRDTMVQLLLASGTPPNNKDILAKQLQEKKAVIWYLGGYGWAIKTRSHFLIFNYRKNIFRLHRAPAVPLLANGQLNPSELKDQNIVVLMINQFLDVHKPGSGFDLLNSVKEIVYISNRHYKEKEKIVVLGPREKKQIGTMEITTIPSTAGGSHLGVMIRVDGLVIFYAGNHGYWEKGQWKAYTGEIDFLRQEMKDSTHIAFLPVPGSSNTMIESQRREFRKGIDYVLEKLHPGAIFPLVTEGEESDAAKVLRDFNANSAVINCPGRRGDRFIYQVN